MSDYAVRRIKDMAKTYFIIYRTEDGSICLLPTKYLKYKIRTHRSPNTVRRIACSLTFFMGYLKEKGMQFEDVFELSYRYQQEFFQDYLDWLKSGKHVSEKSGNSPRNATCNAYLRDVFGFFQFLQMENHQYGQLKVLSEKSVSYASSTGVRRTRSFLAFHGYLKEESSQGKTIQRQAIITLLNACTNCRDQVLLLLMAETGFRIGEILGIRYTEDIDYEKHAIRVEYREDNENDARAKNAAYRWAAISKETYEMLEFYLAKFRDLLKETDYLFINLSGPNKGKALKVDAVYAFLRSIKEKTNMKGTPHMFRHYFAEERRKNGWDLMLISQALGHKNLDTTIRYLNIDNDELAAASNEFYHKNASLYDTGKLL